MTRRASARAYAGNLLRDRLRWQHWLSPQIEFRPEIDYYHSNWCRNAFNLGTKNYTLIAASGDVIVHF